MITNHLALGVFTTLKVASGKPIFRNKHLHRLITHANQLSLLPPDTISEMLDDYLEIHKISEAAIKITLYENKHLTITHRTLPAAADAIQVITTPDIRDSEKIYKTINRKANELSQQQAERQGASDALFIQDGLLIESTMSNIFSINKKGQLITPPIAGRGLAGIIREVIMEQAEVKEEEIPVDTNAPMVLTNSLRLRTVTHINHKRLQDGTALQKQLATIIAKAQRKNLV